MAVVTLTSGGTTILSKTTVSDFIVEMGGFVLVTAPRYKFILKIKIKITRSTIIIAMQVIVKTLSGKTVTLEVKSSETAHFLKDQIYEKERSVFGDCLVKRIIITHILYHSTPPDQQRMFMTIASLLSWH
jgi:hypothetical protein